jgi:hypothetical protein
LGLGTLLFSPTSADDKGRIGCGQARAKTKYKWGLESVAHTTIMGEHTAKAKVLPFAQNREDPKSAILVSAGTLIDG